MGDLVELFPEKKAKAPPLRVVKREHGMTPGVLGALTRENGDALDKALGKHIDPELHKNLAVRLEHEGETLLNLAREAEFLKRGDLAKLIANLSELLSINAAKIIAEYYTEEVT